MKHKNLFQILSIADPIAWRC